MRMHGRIYALPEHRERSTVNPEISRCEGEISAGSTDLYRSGLHRPELGAAIGAQPTGSKHHLANARRTPNLRVFHH